MAALSNSDAVLEPGEVVDGKYEIQTKIGQGGMGIVYKARAISLKRDVALKMLTHVDADTLRRFRREAQSLAQITHPAVVRIDDFGDSGPAGPYLVLAYVSGRNLGAMVENASLSIQDAVDLTLAISSGISACHRRGIIHRDLKPSNIRVTNDTTWQSRVKILDFGLALPFDSPILQAYQTRITNMGSVPGTPRYIAPELLRHQEPTKQCDQYGVASLLYLLTTRRAPFHDLEGDQLLSAITNGSYVAPSLLRPDMPPDLARSIVQGLNLDPAQRFDSVDDFAFALLPHATPSLQNVWTRYFVNAKRPVQRHLIEPVSALPIARKVDHGARIAEPMSDPPQVLAHAPAQAPAHLPSPAHPLPSPRQTPPSPVPAHRASRASPQQQPHSSRRRMRASLIIFSCGVLLGSVTTVGAFIIFFFYQQRSMCPPPPPQTPATMYPGVHGNR
jgi:serine/threonine protein kinase